MACISLGDLWAAWVHFVNTYAWVGGCLALALSSGAIIRSARSARS